MAKKTILIDLDGVLNEYGNTPFDKNHIPPLRKGAEQFLKSAEKLGKLYLFTTRNTIQATKWLIENKIDTYFEDITNIKIPAYIHIDDRCICFNGNYEKTLNEIKKFKPFWKNL